MRVGSLNTPSKVKKICIVGGSFTRNQAPYEDSSWDIWILNRFFHLYSRFNLHFDLHNLSTLLDNDEYMKFIKNNGNKSVLTGLDKRFTEATVYPKDEIIGLYGDFFTNSMSWMIAYAIEQNPTDIALYGVDCLAKEEYIDQRPSIMYLLGIAKGKGIGLHFPKKDCKLFRKNRLYWNL